jgi:uncharacterized membrane protein YkvI
VGGFWAMGVATLIWSIVCALTFAFAFQTRSLDYRSFFTALLGRFWGVYEAAFLLALIVILAVFAAAAGEIGHALTGAPPWVGALALGISIAAFAARGNDMVEGLFKYVSIILYGTYALFFIFALTRFGDRIASAVADGANEGGWFAGGVTYASCNIIGAIVILPATRHFVSRRDAIVAGMLCGPLAMLPAALFFLAMIAFGGELIVHPLPSDFLLSKLDAPWFRILFQIMILAAMLESGVGGVHAINERIAHVGTKHGRRDLSARARFGVTLCLLLFAVAVAARVGLVELVGEGYRWLAGLFIIVYVTPLLTIGPWRLIKPPEGERVEHNISAKENISK